MHTAVDHFMILKVCCLVHTSVCKESVHFHKYWHDGILLLKKMPLRIEESFLKERENSSVYAECTAEYTALYTISYLF